MKEVSPCGPPADMAHLVFQPGSSALAGPSALLAIWYRGEFIKKAVKTVVGLMCRNE